MKTIPESMVDDLENIYKNSFFYNYFRTWNGIKLNKEILGGVDFSVFSSDVVKML